MPRGSRSIPTGVVHKVKYNLRSAPVNSPVTHIDVGQVGQVGTKMAKTFENRDDPEYLNRIEDELFKSRQAREEETKVLNTLLSRMDRLETHGTSVPAVGRGILRTPLKTTHEPLVGGRSPHHDLTSDLSALGAHPAPSDVINGPLTSVLQQLSIAIDPTPQSSVKGLLLRPEYYVQHKDKGVPVKSLDHSKLTFKELMSGMGRVMLHLSKTGGNVSSYIEHFSFLTRKAGAHSFVDSAYVAYDRYVVDQFINGDTESFVPGDLFAVALHFHAGNIAQSPAPAKPAWRGFRGRGYRRGGRQSWFDGDREREKDRDQWSQNPSLDGFPEDLCFNFNYRTCHGKCSKSHVCRLCRGPHKASSGQCTSKK